MKETTKSFLNLLFNEGETICVSDDKYGFHSVEQNLDKISLISPNEKVKTREITENDINLVAINPISGFRRDENITAFRSFLMEFDDMKLAEQKKYVEEMDMPYSICVFSGNKSLHYGIVLDEDLLSLEHWKITNQWILNIMKKADQQNIVPSKSIRFPEVMRKGGKIQKLIDIKKRVNKALLFDWLNQYPEAKPKKDERSASMKMIESPITSMDIPNWIKEELENGITVERDNTWFRISCWFAKRTDIEDTEAILNEFFVEERDFKRSEWLKCIRSAYKTVN